MAVGAVNGSERVPLGVLSVAPEPNYPETSDPEDMAQLADGHTTRFPFWADRKSVGWVNRTPVTVTARIDLPDGGQYALGLRTAMEARADVYPPRRVDIYCRPDGSGEWIHSGSRTHVRDSAEDSAALDLAVPLVACGKGEIQIVLQADGPYLMLDELVLGHADLQSAGASSPRSGSGTLERVSNPAADSRQRLEASLTWLARDRIARDVRGQPGDASFAWLSDPWGDLRIPEGSRNSVELSRRVVEGDELSYVLGIGNPGSGSRRYSLALRPDAPSDTTVSVLAPVLAADGQLVFDAITDLSQDALPVDGGGVGFLLFREGRVTRPGARRIEIADDRGWKQVFTVNVDVLDRIRPEDRDRPRFIAWTYTNDRPIWRDDNAVRMVEQLAAAGVNVFDIHPAHIPMPLNEAGWPARVSLLKSDLELYRGKGLVLLFLGDAAWEQLVNLPEDAETRRRMARWTGLLATTMREAGFKDGEWALYPVDEPNGEDLARLARVISRLRSIDGNLRFYANPTVPRGKGLLSIPALWQLKGLVDFWQPLAGEAFEAVVTALGDDGRGRVWVYQNPPEPAKSASPACYRATVTRAFDAGARGIGFWSFSSTSESSAWSDFDGRQPDWAVAYESPPGARVPFVSSRRWEAYKQGVRDFAVLGYCSRQSAGDAVVAGQCAAYRRSIDAEPGGNCRP